MYFVQHTRPVERLDWQNLVCKERLQLFGVWVTHCTLRLWTSCEIRPFQYMTTTSISPMQRVPLLHRKSKWESPRTADKREPSLPPYQLISQTWDEGSPNVAMCGVIVSAIGQTLCQTVSRGPAGEAFGQGLLYNWLVTWKNTCRAFYTRCVDHFGVELNLRHFVALEKNYICVRLPLRASATPWKSAASISGLVSGSFTISLSSCGEVECVQCCWSETATIRLPLLPLSSVKQAV